MQGRGRGPSLHLVASGEEQNHSNHVLLHSVKSSPFIKAPIGNYVTLTNDNFWFIPFIESLNRPTNIL